MVEKIKCKSEGCTATILPATAESTGGVCMRCKRAADQASYEEYIRKNQIAVDPFKGVSDPVEIIKIRHQSRKCDPLIAYLPHPTPPAEVYEALTEVDLARLIQCVCAKIAHEDKMVSEGDATALEIARELAAFTDADLTRIQRALVDIGEYYPGYIFRQASPAIARTLMERLAGATENDRLKRNHILQALAWTGTDAVVSQFAEWRRQPPEWWVELYVPPECYAHCAGWELDADGGMRRLVLGKCYRLVKAPPGSEIGPVTTCLELGEACRWCGTLLISLFTFDLDHELLGFIPFRGRKLTIATCHICSAFGDGRPFMKVGPDGEARWYAGNDKPPRLPKNIDEFEGLPANQVRLSPKPRLLHHAIDWCLPTTFSQVGGMPSWIQDNAHSQCLECGKGLVFVAQLAVEDLDAWGEGIYYALMCPDCSITRVHYQQT